MTVFRSTEGVLRRGGSRPAASVVVAAVLLSGLLLSTPSRVTARAVLVRTYPVPGAVLRFVPPFVSLWFSEELEPALSTVAVAGPRGITTPAGSGGVDPGDPTRRTLRADVRPLRAGVYTVRWRAVSAGDGTAVVGTFQFTVKP